MIQRELPTPDNSFNGMAIEPEVVGIPTKLSDIEDKHKQGLYDLYLTIELDPFGFRFGMKNEVLRLF